MTELSLEQYFKGLEENRRANPPNNTPIRPPKNMPGQKGTPSKSTPSKLDVEGVSNY